MVSVGGKHSTMQEGGDLKLKTSSWKELSLQLELVTECY